MTIVLLSEAITVGAGQAGAEVHGLDFARRSDRLGSGSASGQDSPRSLALLAFLETNTEADEAVTVAGGVAVALSRTQGRPADAPGTTPFDPIRARCRTGGIDHRVAGGISRLVSIRGPLPDISVHVKEAPRVGRILPHIASLSKIVSIISTAIPIIIRIRAGNARPP